MRKITLALLLATALQTSSFAALNDMMDSVALKDLQNGVVFDLSDPLTSIDTSAAPKYISVLISEGQVRSLPVVQDPFGGNGIDEYLPRILKERACLVGFRKWQTEPKISSIGRSVVGTQSFGSGSEPAVIVRLDDNFNGPMIECPVDFTVGDFKKLVKSVTQKDSVSIAYQKFSIYGGVIRNKKTQESLAAGCLDSSCSQLKLYQFSAPDKNGDFHILRELGDFKKDAENIKKTLKDTRELNGGYHTLGEGELGDEGFDPAIPYQLTRYSFAGTIVAPWLIFVLIPAAPIETALLPIQGGIIAVDKIVEGFQDLHMQNAIHKMLTPSAKGRETKLSEKRYGIVLQALSVSN